MTRAQHVEWCKQRAREYLAIGDVTNAVTSMMSDMNKHPECRVNDALVMLGMMTVQTGDLAGAHRFVEGFN